MIRSLVIRQVFRFLDVALLVAVLGAGVMVVKQFTTPMPPMEVDPDLLLSQGIEVAGVVRGPGALSDYDALVKSGLFGGSGRWDPDAAPVEAPPEPEIEIAPDIAESALNLKLKGTIALAPGDPFSAAFIENTEKRSPAQSFLIGQEVVDKVSLELVYPREVILVNKRHDPPQRERLRMEDKQLAGAGSTPSPMVASAGESGAPVRPDPVRAMSDSPVERITINREEMIHEVLENYTALSTMRPQLKRDESGNVLGITADNISEQPLASKMGFEDDDVLQTINNERIDSEEKIMEILQKYQNATSFRVGLLRNGVPQVITYRLE